MRIHDTAKKEKMMGVLVLPEARRILSLTVAVPKSIADISKETGMPARSVYRYVEELCAAGVLVHEQNVLMEGGGKFACYRSMVKSVTFSYNGENSQLDVDLIPNDSILDRFIRFWTYMSK